MKNLKSKVGFGLVGFLSLTSLANAAVTADSATGNLSGSLDLGPFFTAFSLVIVAAASMWSAKKALSMFRS
ncbi:putative membrane protein [Campylobacter iguaniorum]|uniref:hypothetical protein n=1 Tax=Campylobacter iguaniorum TaxID=1244531 RepID=UPI0007C8D63C|nr:hypothetical protein [Campylobacter iguaniorum]ANE35834.1 putative membrane protein [Campylobacter iguaniorum]